MKVVYLLRCPRCQHKLPQRVLGRLQRLRYTLCFLLVTGAGGLGLPTPPACTRLAGHGFGSQFYFDWLGKRPSFRYAGMPSQQLALGATQAPRGTTHPSPDFSPLSCRLRFLLQHTSGSCALHSLRWFTPQQQRCEQSVGRTATRGRVKATPSPFSLSLNLSLTEHHGHQLAGWYQKHQRVSCVEWAIRVVSMGLGSC